MCKASVSDVTLPVAERWAALGNRLVYAPLTEMTEDSVREAEAQMLAVRGEAERAARDGQIEEVTDQ